MPAQSCPFSTDENAQKESNLILPRTSLYGVRHCLIAGSEHIERSNATSSLKKKKKKSLTFSFTCLIKVCLSHRFVCPDFHDCSRIKPREEKVNISRNFIAADDPRPAADKTRAVRLSLRRHLQCIVSNKRIFPHLKSNASD